MIGFSRCGLVLTYRIIRLNCVPTELHQHLARRKVVKFLKFKGSHHCTIAFGATSSRPQCKRESVLWSHYQDFNVRACMCVRVCACVMEVGCLWGRTRLVTRDLRTSIY